MVEKEILLNDLSLREDIRKKKVKKDSRGLCMREHIKAFRNGERGKK